MVYSCRHCRRGTSCKRRQRSVRCAPEGRCRLLAGCGFAAASRSGHRRDAGPCRERGKCAGHHRRRHRSDRARRMQRRRRHRQWPAGARLRGQGTRTGRSGPPAARPWQQCRTMLDQARSSTGLALPSAECQPLETTQLIPDPIETPADVVERAGRGTAACPGRGRSELQHQCLFAPLSLVPGVRLHLPALQRPASALPLLIVKRGECTVKVVLARGRLRDILRR
jgi:hypothetical protein